MKRELANKRRKLLTRLTRKEYNAYRQFVEKIYLEDFELKILMARKFSNLFISLLELAREENGGRVRHLYEEKYVACGKEPIIISNRALAFIKQNIISGNIKKILLADDIIIHGRTLNTVYELLKSWFEEAGIQDYIIEVYAYAESKEDLLDVPVLKKRHTEVVCTKAEWRNISNQIVDIFYLMGQPYTSYIPNYRVQEDSYAGRKIKKFLKEKVNMLVRITNQDMEMRHVQSYMYLRKSFSDVSLACTVRIYDYKDIGEFLVVPMVTLKPMTQDQLEKYMGYLRKWMDIGFVEKCDQLLQEKREESYRCVIYGLSALWGWKFAKEQLNIDMEEVYYDKREEQYNFSQNFWCKIGSEQEVGSLVDMLLLETCSEKSKVCESLSSIVENDVEIKRLNDILEEVIKQSIDRKDDPLRDWSSNNEQKEVLKAVMGKFLAENGRVDEEKCKNLEFERSMGIPLCSLICKLLERFKDEISIFASILYAIDFGKGSIVAKRYGNYYVSFIHAGEQNYKYYENHYFPFLYGMYRLETEGLRKGNIHDVEEKKNEFINEYLQYWKQEQLYYIETDIDYIKRISIEKEYYRVLLYDLLDYSQNPHLQYAIKLIQQKVMELKDENHKRNIYKE